MRRLTKRTKIQLGCLLALCLLAVPAGRFGWRCYEWMVWGNAIRGVEKGIDSLKARRPADITPEHWDEAIRWANTALWNLWPWDVDTRDELADFAASFEKRVATEDSLAALQWLWEELERRSDTGPRYAAQYKPVRAMNPDPITDANLRQLWGLSACMSLDLSGTEVGDAGLSCLVEAQNLEQLVLSNVRVTDRGLAELAGLPRPRAFELKGCRITGGGLSELSHIRYLNLANTTIADEGLSYLAQLAHLEELDLSGTQITDSGLDHLNDLSALAKLSLSSTLVTNAGLQALQHLSQLVSLDLGHTQISEVGLVHISALVQLDVLRLDHTQVNDDALQHLSRLPRLRYLSLQGTRITGDGLHHLMGSSKLRYLLLPEDMPHREELHRLHQAIPECWIYLGGRFWLTQPVSNPRGQGEEDSRSEI